MNQSTRSTIVWLLVQRLKDSGKTKIVKLLFLLQETFGVPLGYRFRLHHYGPYAFEVDDDLTSLELEGKLSVTPDAQGYGYHVISLRDPSPQSVVEADLYLAQLDGVLGRFGGESVNSLEILTTVVFLNQLTHTTGEELIARVSALKPRYSVDFIRDTVRRTEEEALLKQHA